MACQIPNEVTEKMKSNFFLRHINTVTSPVVYGEIDKVCTTSHWMPAKRYCYINSPISLHRLTWLLSRPYYTRSKNIQFSRSQCLLQSISISVSPQKPWKPDWIPDIRSTTRPAIPDRQRYCDQHLIIESSLRSYIPSTIRYISMRYQLFQWTWSHLMIWDFNPVCTDEDINEEFDRVL